MPFPELKDWKAPWEAKGEEIDAEKAKAFAYAEKKRAHDLEEANKKLTKERDEALQEASHAKAEAKKATETAEETAAREAAEREEREAAQRKKDAEARAKLERENLVLKVQRETGLDEDVIERLKGETVEELVADAKAFAEKVGFELPASKASDDAAENEDPNPALRQPRKPGLNPGDPDPDKGGAKTPEQIAEQIATEDRGYVML